MKILFNRLRVIQPKGYQRGSLVKSHQNGNYLKQAMWTSCLPTRYRSNIFDRSQLSAANQLISEGEQAHTAQLKLLRKLFHRISDVLSVLANEIIYLEKTRNSIKYLLHLIKNKKLAVQLTLPAFSWPRLSEEFFSRCSKNQETQHYQAKSHKPDCYDKSEVHSRYRFASEDRHRAEEFSFLACKNFFLLKSYW